MGIDLQIHSSQLPCAAPHVKRMQGTEVLVTTHQQCKDPVQGL